MISSGHTGSAGQTDNRLLVYLVIGRDIDLAQVRVETKNSLAMVNHYHIAINSQVFGKYHNALQLYRAQDFRASAAIFSDLQRQNPIPLYALYLERINAFLSQPPDENWDGVFVATTK